nr:MAG TPA: hypothetical protein [Caudoviricetes sp.]
MYYIKKDSHACPVSRIESKVYLMNVSQLSLTRILVLNK